MLDVLLIDDDPALIPEQVRQTFPAPAHRVRVATTGADGIAHFRREPPDVVLLDLRLPDQSGLEVYQRIRAIDARVPVIFVTMAKAAEAAIEAMKHGAYDYLHKPLDLRRLRHVVGEAAEVARLCAPVAWGDAASEAGLDGSLLGASPAMLEVYKSVGRVAAQDVNVLITGESGTGKELVARAIYQHSARAKGPFMALNCAAIPEALLESELFGHERGAFTGADRRRIGKFEQCNGGTILLDEIGDMPLALQAKMLRLLQEQRFERVGGNETIHTDVRVIASTHRDLKARAVAETFRADLYYRLSVFELRLPSLRERGDDVELLSRHFVQRFAHELSREVRDIDPDALALLRAHAWPGNVRELQSVLKQALLQARGRVLLPAFLPTLPRTAADAEAPSGLDLERLIAGGLKIQDGELYAATHREVDRVLLARALDHTAGNHREAARLLGISRQTLRVKLRALGLQVKYAVELDDSQQD